MRQAPRKSRQSCLVPHRIGNVETYGQVIDRYSNENTPDLREKDRARRDWKERAREGERSVQSSCVRGC